MELKLDELGVESMEESLLNTVSPEISLQVQQVNSAKDDDKDQVNEDEDSDIQEAENEDGTPPPSPKRGKKKKRAKSVSDDSEGDEHSVSTSPPPPKKGKKTPAAITKNQASKNKRGRPVVSLFSIVRYTSSMYVSIIM